MPTFCYFITKEGDHLVTPTTYRFYFRLSSTKETRGGTCDMMLDHTTSPIRESEALVKEVDILRLLLLRTKYPYYTPHLPYNSYSTNRGTDQVVLVTYLQP